METDSWPIDGDFSCDRVVRKIGISAGLECGLLARRADSDRGRQIAGEVQILRSRTGAQNKIVGGTVCDV